MPGEEDMLSLIEQRDRLQDWITCQCELISKSPNHEIDMVKYTETMKLIRVCNIKIMLLTSVANASCEVNSAITTPITKTEEICPILTQSIAKTEEHPIINTQKHNQIHIVNCKTTLIEIQTNIINALNNLINIQSNPTLNLELTTRLNGLTLRHSNIQNRLELQMNKLLELQKKVVVSIESAHKNVQQNIINRYITQFDELNNSIVEHTKESTNILNHLNMKAKQLNLQGANESGIMPKVPHYINETDQTTILVVMPTYNRSECIENSIEMMNKQTYNNWILLIIDDGSTENHKHKFREIRDQYQSDKIIFQENDANCHIAKTLNKGIQYLIDSETNFTHFTWISDDNKYYPHFLAELYYENTFFKYGAYHVQEKDCYVNTYNVQYQGFDGILDNFNGCASFMWTKEAINKIGFYDESVPGCEDYEYLLRTFKLNELDCKFTDMSTMKYIRHETSLMEQNTDTIMILKNAIKTIYTHMNTTKSSFVYYSKTNYQLLFQRPHQIMRFFSKEYNKCFIGLVDNVEYEDKYNLLVVPYYLKTIVSNATHSNTNNQTITYYYTDTRLYDEINKLHGQKIFDLIDAPIDEFSIWKPNLEKCVKTSDYIMYSHPELVNYLNDIDNTKTYHYFSNGCDYEHFSKAKERIGERPIDFPQTDKPILGYFGSFAKWLDYDVINQYADEGIYHIVMIGGIVNNASYNIRFAHPNITWLDHKPYDVLPYYLSWFDVCFLPFKDCELVKYVNPCKLWEYMASEKEIIKTNVNIDCSKLIKYEDECSKIIDKVFCIVNCIKKYDIKNELNFNDNIEYFTKINNKNKNKNKLIINDKPVIIAFSMIDYFFRVQRSQHLMRLCSENGYTVFYLKTQINTETTDTDIKEIYPNLYEVRLWCETNRQISVYSTDLTSREINSLITCIESIKFKYNFNHFISYIANPFWVQLVKYMNNTSVVFDCLDYVKGFNTHSETIIRLEEEIIEKEYVIYTSPVLKEFTNCQHNNFSYIRNGCDFKYFNQIRNNQNYEKTRKIVGYYGAISDWWDVNLVEQVIKRLPDIDFHFIGSVFCYDPLSTKKINDLKNLSNVTFFGEIPYDKLDIYISKFDVGIIPFIINDLIRCTNPVKLYEMFAFGIPVVLTELPDVLTLGVNHLCYLSKNVDDFIENITSALSEEKINNIVVNERIKYAEQNCWQNRFEQFDVVVNKIMPKISIVLLCWNNWSTTKTCIDSVLQNSNYSYFELIIVNNYSTDETFDQLNMLYKDTSNITIIHNTQNYGFAMGMNIGALHASYEYIILLNNDTIVSKNWLYPLVKPLILNDYGTGSPITNNCGNEVKQFIHFTNIEDLLPKAYALQKYNNFKICDIDRVPFFCPVLRKKDFFAVGMLDINYKFGGWEDDDLLHKIKIYNNNKQNYYTFGSFVYHMESLSMAQISGTQNWCQVSPNKTYFEKKWSSTWVPPKYHIPSININIQSSQKWINDLIKSANISGNSIFRISTDIENNESIIIKDTIPDKIQDNEVIITVDKEKQICLSNNFESCTLKNNNKIIQLYSFINTLLFCKQLERKIVFIHIEKCGGSTIKLLVENSLQNEEYSCYCENIDYLDKNNYELTKSIFKKHNCMLFHMNIDDIYLYLRDIKVINLTMIRNPIKRIISHFYHMTIDQPKCIINGEENKLFKQNITLQNQDTNFIINYIINYGNLIVYRLGFTHTNFEKESTHDFECLFNQAISNISKIKYIFLLEDLQNEIMDYNKNHDCFKINYENIVDNNNDKQIYKSSSHDDYEFLLQIINEHNIILYDVLFYNHICKLKNKEQFKCII